VIDPLDREEKFTKTCNIVTELPKKKKKKDKTDLEAKPVDQPTIEPPPPEPIGARFPTRSLGYVKFTSNIPASEEPERKKKRKKRDGASEDHSSRKEKKKRRKTGDHVRETPTTAGPSSSSIPAPTTPELSASDIEEYLQSNSITLTAAKNGLSIKPVLSFDQLQIPPELKAALSGFQNPTPIQACSWPPALQGQDVVGIAETGRYDDIPILIHPGLRMMCD